MKNNSNPLTKKCAPFLITFIEIILSSGFRISNSAVQSFSLFLSILFFYFAVSIRFTSPFLSILPFRPPRNRHVTQNSKKGNFASSCCPVCADHDDIYFPKKAMIDKVCITSAKLCVTISHSFLISNNQPGGLNRGLLLNLPFSESSRILLTS